MASQYKELFAEIESVQDAYQWDFLNALQFVARHTDQYGSVIKSQVEQFFREGYEFFGEPE